MRVPASRPTDPRSAPGCPWPGRAPPGASGRRPPVGGRGRWTEDVHPYAGHGQQGPGASSSSVARRRRPDRGPVTASARSCRLVPAPWARSGPVRDPGTGRPSRVPGDLGFPPGRIRSVGRRRRTRLRLPGGSARCSGAVGGGSRREPSCVEVGRRPEVHRRREPAAADVGLQGRWLGDRVVGRGHPGKRATGLGVLGVCGGRRPAAGCRGRAVLLSCGGRRP